MTHQINDVYAAPWLLLQRLAQTNIHPFYIIKPAACFEQAVLCSSLPCSPSVQNMLAMVWRDCVLGQGNWTSIGCSTDWDRMLFGLTSARSSVDLVIYLAEGAHTGPSPRSVSSLVQASLNLQGNTLTDEQLPGCKREQEGPCKAGHMWHSQDPHPVWKQLSDCTITTKRSLAVLLWTELSMVSHA